MLRVALHIDDLTEVEARNLASGTVSNRIASVARKALLKAAEEAERTGAISYEERQDGAWIVRNGVEIVGTARHYVSYWQIYMRTTRSNIRRSTWPLLKTAIEEALRDVR